MVKDISTESGFSVLTNANTWLIVLSVVTIIVTIWNMWKLWTDKPSEIPWTSWIANIVMFLVAAVSFVMWAAGSLTCYKSVDVESKEKAKKTFRSNE